MQTESFTFRPREFTYAYKKTSYVPTAAPVSGEDTSAPATATAPSRSGGPAAKRPRIDGSDPSPTASRICSTPVKIYNYKFSHQVHKFTLGFMYGV
jgi:hypothetical protein